MEAEGTKRLEASLGNESRMSREEAGRKEACQEDVRGGWRTPREEAGGRRQERGGRRGEGRGTRERGEGRGSSNSSHKDLRKGKVTKLEGYKGVPAHAVVQSARLHACTRAKVQSVL